MATVAELSTKELPNWCPACVLPGSLIHTNPSTKKIEEITVGDRVLGKDGRYHDVTEIMVHRHRGKMYRITAKCFGDTVVTGEHPVLVSRRMKKSFNNTSFTMEWVRADTVRKSDYFPYPILKEEDDIAEIDLPANKKAMDRKSKELPPTLPLTADVLRLIGYYLAVGHVHKREIVWTFNAKEREYAEDVVRVCRDAFGLHATTKTKENKTDVVLASSMLANIFVRWFGTGAQNKKIPKFLMLLPSIKQKELIEGMWRGDGWVDIRGKRASYKTISPVIKEQLKQLLLRQNIVPTISVDKAYDIHKESYSIQVVSGRDVQRLAGILGMSVPSFVSRSKKPPIILDDRYAYLPVRRIESWEYDGPVHNMEVADVHCYVGESAILHNCGDFNILFGIKNALAQLEVPQENVLVVSGIGCLPPEEKISVGNDWVPIADVRGSDMIINGDGNFTPIAFKTLNEFDGDMLEIVPFVSPFNSFRLTPEHPVLCVRRKSIRTRNQIDAKKPSCAKPDFVDAGSLEEGDYVVFNWNREIKDSAIFTESFCRLLGYYLAEGYVGEGGGRNRDGAQVSFAVNSNEKELIDDISALSLQITGRKPYIRERKNIGNVVELTICSKKLALLLKKLAGKGAGKKKLAEEIMLLPPKKQKEIIDAYFKGDGYSGIAPLGRHRYFRANTLSLSLAVQMQELLARQGIFASLYWKKMKPHVYKGRAIIPSGDQVFIAYQPEKEFSSVQKTKYGFLVPIKKINRAPYKGPVHNLETKTDPHSYLVKGFVVHNCGSKTPHFMNTYGFEGLHGRSLPVATGAKLVNPDLNVIVVVGDGDGYGIGGNHFVHTMRRNMDVTMIVQNNAVYGLTKGQYSPTTRKGFTSPSSPRGSIEEPLNPLAMALTCGATYVARGYAYEVQHLVTLIRDAIAHKGFSLVDVFQPCSTYNKIQTIAWFKQHVYKLEDEGHDPGDKAQAFAKALEWEENRIPIGLFYKAIRPTYDEQAIDHAVVNDDISNIDVTPMLERAK